MRWGWIAAAVVVAAIGLWLVREWQYGGQPVEVAVLATEPIAEFIEERGRTRLPKTTLITMPYDGRVAEITWQEGAVVEAGEVVAKLVPADIDARLAEAKASVSRLEASLTENNDERVERSTLLQSLKMVDSMNQTVNAAKAQVEAGTAKREFALANLKRIRQLFEKGTVTQQEYDRTELDLVEATVEERQDQLIYAAMQSMQAATELVPVIVTQYIERKALSGAVLTKERDQAEARLDQVELNQRRSTMTSPINGIVLERKETNERVLPAGTVLLELGTLAELEVEADLLSQDVVRVQLGDRVEIYGPAIGPQPVLGKVKRVYPSGFTKISSLGVEEQRVRVIIHFEPGLLSKLIDERQLGVGYRVQVRVFTDEKAAAPVVPRAALFRGPQGDWQLFVVRDGVARLQSVKVGLMNDERVEIAHGLAAGEAVILSPEARLTDGTRVRAVLGK